jgi:glycosyltransferase involved in cell wall biosynthesis
MNIIHIIESTATGTLSIASMAANRQVEYNSVSVIYSRREDTPKNLSDEFSKKVYFIEQSMGPKDFPSCLFRLRKHLKQLSPDIIHCHSSFAGFVGRLASLGLKTKVFYSPHCISFMRKDIGLFKATLFKCFELIGCIKSATYIACSQSEKNVIEKALPFSKVELLENAVDLSEFDCADHSAISVDCQSSGRLARVVTVGGIRPQKGPVEFAAIAQQFKDKELEFIWIGDGDSETKQILTEAGVEVTGWKSRQEVIKELYRADLYLSTALWEGMPVSLIEASAANLPILARNCAGNIDVIEHKKTGHLFSTTASAIELLELYLKDEKVFTEASEKAYQSVFKRFSVERFAQQLEQIYNK